MPILGCLVNFSGEKVALKFLAFVLTNYFLDELTSGDWVFHTSLILFNSASSKFASWSLMSWKSAANFYWTLEVLLRPLAFYWWTIISLLPQKLDSLVTDAAAFLILSIYALIFLFFCISSGLGDSSPLELSDSSINPFEFSILLSQYFPGARLTIPRRIFWSRGVKCFLL